MKHAFLIPLIIRIVLLSSCNNKETSNETDVPESNNYQFNNIVGVDAYGRSFEAISSYKKDRQAGLFFWIWIGQPYTNGIYDATEILSKPDGLDILTKQNVSTSPDGQAHFWGKPLWGYYNSDDEWVIRKQIQMLTLAGIDFIYFDTTNSWIYKNVFMEILKVIAEYQDKGWTPPKVVFYNHSKSNQTTEALYNELYKPGHYPSTWYRINGKPVIIAYTKIEDDLNEAKSRNDGNYSPTPLSDEILNFFYFMKPQWPSDPFYADGFPWVEWQYPQPLHTNVMNVTVASHPAVPMSFSLTRNLINWGRGWNPETNENISEEVDKGTFFQLQWDHAIKNDPEMISIGGWNEWIAYKQIYDGEYMLCDAVNKEYSRDIEPMEGGYEDAFYIQLIKNIRRYKGLKANIQKGKQYTINISEKMDQWNDIEYSQINIGSDDIARNSFGASQSVHYSKEAPEHILQEVKVANDHDNIYFYIRSNKSFEGSNQRPFLLVGTGEPGLKEWECYDYMIGNNNDSFIIHKIGKDYVLSQAGNVACSVNKEIIQIKIPREAMELEKNDRFYFKVACETDNPKNIMSYYTSGSSMPMGRLSYMYDLK